MLVYQGQLTLPEEKKSPEGVPTFVSSKLIWQELHQTNHENRPPEASRNTFPDFANDTIIRSTEQLGRQHHWQVNLNDTQNCGFEDD